MLTCPKCGFPNGEGARFCSNCGNALSAARPIEGERRFATVLFADVARSTAIAEKLDPEDWALIINGAFAFMNATVARYEGTVSRLMGDAVLALFGAPVAHEDDAERAVRAGLEIQAAGMDYARGVKAKHGVDFDLRVGINTGTSVLAFVGDAVKTEYTALGDAANVAARLQSLAEPGTVLISADTERLVHALFDFKPRGRIEMKGKAEPVECFEVVGLKATPGSTRGLEGLSSELVGRDAEFGLLRDRLAGLAKGDGGVVAVVGEAGLGKSRLVAELRHARDTLPEPRPAWLEARAISYGRTIPYYPWQQLGRQLIGADDIAPPAEVREKLAAFVERLQLQTYDLPFYETMLSVDSEESRTALAGLSGDALVNGVAAAVVNAFKAAIQGQGKRPYVLVMDDLHWSDSASLELLAQVATLAAFEPLLIVAVLRPDHKAQSWQLVDRLQASLGESFARIDLEPLDAEASNQLLGNLLRIEGLPQSIRMQILERSEGNPFYLEEVLRSLIDGGQVVREDDHWRATSAIADVKIPETLAGVLSARIDRLPDATKRVAQTAAVIGRVFQHRILESVCRAAPAQERIEHVEPHLATLSYEQLVRERSRDPEREYIFKHALTCEAAYELLLRSRRRELHARCGSALEMLLGDRREEMAAVLAHHFAESNDLPRALQYSRAAAANARRLFALREEVGHRANIVDVLDRTPDAMKGEIVDAIIEWAWVRMRLAEYDGVEAALERAIVLSRESADKRRLAAALSWMGNYWLAVGYPSKSVPFIVESSALAHEVGDDQLLLLPQFFGTWSLVDRDPAAAVDQLQQVIDLSRKRDFVDILGHAQAYRATALARTGNFVAARAEIAEALKTVEITMSPVKKADIHIAVGMAFHDMGMLDEGLEHARLGAELAESAHGLECACAGHFGVGRVQLDRMQLDDALTEFARSLQLSDLSGYEGFLNVIRGGVAVAEFGKGQTVAVDQLVRARDNANSLNDEYATAVLSQQLADLYVRLGRHDEAEEALGIAMSYYRGAGMKPYVARGLEIEARALDGLGKIEEAAQARMEAKALMVSEDSSVKTPEVIA
jgi:class 3 adenylate cyclase/tetratricopeptide (TPR) repeat protein